MILFPIPVSCFLSQSYVCQVSRFFPVAPLWPQAHKLIFGAEKVLVIDVRSAREHKNETIFNSRNASLYDIPPSWPLGAIDVVLSSGNDDLMPRFSTAFETQIAAALGPAGKVRDSSSSSTHSPSWNSNYRAHSQRIV